MAHKQRYLLTENFLLQPIYSCIHCRANLAYQRDLISKSFQGSQGRAYLFNSVINIGSLVAEERMLLTGLHYVADIYCESCSYILGWKYEKAFEPNQRYKEGKFIIEVANLIKDNCWDELWKSSPKCKNVRKQELFNINWDTSSDSISKGPVLQPNDGKCCSKSYHQKTSFIKDLSRDLQQILGITEKRHNLSASSKVDAALPEAVIIADDISNSTMSTSLNMNVNSDSYIRMNSDECVDSLTNSFSHCITENSENSCSRHLAIYTHLSTTETNTDNSSLNNSSSSSKGLLGCNEVSISRLKESKESIIQCCSTSNQHQQLPSNQSLSLSTGTSSKSNPKPRRRSRRRCRAKYSSNVVKPQRIE